MRPLNYVCILLILFSFFLRGSAYAALGSGELTIHTEDGDQKFKIEIARSEEDQEQGLMYRTSLDKDAGMLFVYTSPQDIRMWMKNTLIPLDMLFIRADGTISSIRKRAIPLSQEIIPSQEPVSDVLELNGGTVDRLNIKAGDKVTGDGFSPAS